jgi:hypothetical protein
MRRQRRRGLDAHPDEAARGEAPVGGEAQIPTRVPPAARADRASRRERRGARVGHPVDDLVERAVASDGDDERPARAGRLARELGRVTAATGRGEFEPEAEPGQLITECAPRA